MKPTKDDDDHYTHHLLPPGELAHPPRSERRVPAVIMRKSWLNLLAPGRAVRIPWRLVLLGAVVFALPTTLALYEKHEGEEGIETQVQVQSVMTEVHIQEGLERQLIGGDLSVQDVRNGLAASRARVQGHLTEAERLCLSSDAAAQIRKVTQGYSQSVDEQVRLLSLGSKQEAAEFDEAEVDPAFAHVLTILDDQARHLKSQGEKTQRLSDLWVLLTILLSLTVVGVVQSRRRRAAVRSQAMQQSQAHYRTLIDQSSDLVLVVDRAGQASFVSPSLERLLAPPDQDRATSGIAPADAGLIDFVAALDPRDREGFTTALRTAVPGKISAGEFRLTGRHGTATFEMSLQDLTSDPSVAGVVLTAHDVTDRLALQHEMEYRALHDELTGLPNRALLADRFEHALLGAERTGTSVGLLVLDLDRFKEVNDTFGHHHGDELLRQIGPRLAGVLRGVDTLARLGGDEFAVLLQDVRGVGDAIAVAKTLLAALTPPFQVEGVDLDVEASIGVVLSGAHGEDAVTLLKHADIAMYAAKGQHLGVFAYDPTVDVHFATRPAIVGALHGALDRDDLAQARDCIDALRAQQPQLISRRLATSAPPICVRTSRSPTTMS